MIYIRSRGNDIYALDATAPTGGATQGAFKLVEDTWGIAFRTVLVGIMYSLVYHCTNISVPKATGTGNSFAIGDPVYLNTSNLNVVNAAATGLLLIGTCLEAAGIGDERVWIDMDTRKIDG